MGKLRPRKMCDSLSPVAGEVSCGTHDGGGPGREDESLWQGPLRRVPRHLPRKGGGKVGAMSDLLNFHDVLFTFTSNWVWIATALGLGIWFGWATAAEEAGS